MLPGCRTPAALVALLSLLAPAVAFAAAAIAAEREAPLTAWERHVAPVLAGGGSGLAFFPSPTGQATEIVDPQGFTVHLTSADDPGEERVHPAGVPFQPPPGRFRVWMQGGDLISPSSLLIVFARRREEVVRPSFVRVGPGGHVVLPPGAGADGGDELWLLHAQDDERHYELSRRRPLDEAADGVLMPAGRTLAALWDRHQERFVALGRPFTVPAGRAVAADLGRPAEAASHLVLFAARPLPLVNVPLAGVLPAVTQGERTREADLVLANRWGVYGVWYDLAPGPARLGGGSGELYVDPRALELPAGGIERLEVPLHGRPLLDVTLVLPREAREKRLELAVRTVPGGDELARVELPRTAGRHRFHDGLIAGPTEVVLSTAVGTFRRRVELTAGEETFLELEPELIEITGTVRRGGEPHAATVRFRTVAGDTVEAAADEEGGYRALALQPLAWVAVELDGVEQEPWEDFLMPPLRRSAELDFDLSDAAIVVRVVDARTGTGIAGAELGVRREEASPAAVGDDDLRAGTGRGRAYGRDHTADGDGVVRLPPPRPGRLVIHASAEGYRPAAEPLVVEVPDPPQDREVEIALQPAGATVAVRLTLPGGAPAAGAEVMRIEGAGGRPGPALFTGRADEAGVVHVPVEPTGGLLLVRHPAAASAVVDWARRAAEERVEHTLPPPAPVPLALRVLDPSGEVPASGAGLTLWIGDRRLSGGVLAWLTQAPPRADGSGTWISRRLPAQPVRVLAWSREIAAEIEAGGYDALATEVPYPWPATVEIEAIR